MKHKGSLKHGESSTWRISLPARRVDWGAAQLDPVHHMFVQGAFGEEQGAGFALGMTIETEVRALVQKGDYVILPLYRGQFFLL